MHNRPWIWLATFSYLTAATGLARESPVPSDPAAPPAVHDSALDHTGTVLVFSPQQVTLDTIAKAELRRLIDDARSIGRLRTVHVAVWSDKEFPAQSRAELPEADQKIAAARGAAVRGYLVALKVPEVVVYNMAKGTSLLAKAFNTEDSEVKAVFAGEKRAPKRGTRQEILAFRDYGAPSLAVVVVESDKTVSH